MNALERDIHWVFIVTGFGCFVLAAFLALAHPAWLPGTPAATGGNPEAHPASWGAAEGFAVAGGLCFAALGTDTGGSIRYPSGMNGIVGLKPTWGRVSRRGVLDLAPSLDHVGPMTRSVADAAVVLGAIAGPDPDDPTSLPDPVPDYVADLDGGVSGLRGSGAFGPSLRGCMENSTSGERVTISGT